MKPTRVWYDIKVELEKKWSLSQFRKGNNVFCFIKQQVYILTKTLHVSLFYLLKIIVIVSWCYYWNVWVHVVEKEA